MNRTPSLTVLDASRLSAGQRNYWLSSKLHTRLACAGVDTIDPFRRPLRDLRQLFPVGCHKVYRASTGGRYGKSSQIVSV